MHRWIQYWSERLPIASYGLLSTGFALSALALSRHLENAPHPLLILLGILGVFFSLAQLRLMDDIKDIAKDKVGNPGRPLARGLIHPQEAQMGVALMGSVMTALGAGLIGAGYVAAGFFYLLIVIYQSLMYREFYSPKLANYPILYAITHELVLIPVLGFLLALAGNHEITTLLGLFLMLWGAFFCYEICRKLQPNAPEALGYYRTIYGLKKTLLLGAAACLLAALGSYILHIQILTWPLELALLWQLYDVWRHQTRYRRAEQLASASLLVHAWAAALITLWINL